MRKTTLHPCTRSDARPIARRRETLESFSAKRPDNVRIRQEYITLRCPGRNCNIDRQLIRPGAVFHPGSNLGAYRCSSTSYLANQSRAEAMDLAIEY